MKIFSNREIEFLTNGENLSEHYKAVLKSRIRDKCDDMLSALGLVIRKNVLNVAQLTKLLTITIEILETSGLIEECTDIQKEAIECLKKARRAAIEKITK